MGPADAHKQFALFGAHTPTDEISSAAPWAHKTAGPGARVHYTGPEDNFRMPGQHRVSISMPLLKDQVREDVASLDWDPHHGMVTLVQTNPKHRQKGLASGLWSIAKSLGEEFDGVSRVRHSDVQTPAGRQWAKKVGD